MHYVPPSYWFDIKRRRITNIFDGNSNLSESSRGVEIDWRSELNRGFDPRSIIGLHFIQLPLHNILLSAHGAILEDGGYNQQSGEYADCTSPKDHVFIKLALGLLGIFVACGFSIRGVWWFIYWADRPFWWLWCAIYLFLAILLTWQSYGLLPS